MVLEIDERKEVGCAQHWKERLLHFQGAVPYFIVKSLKGLLLEN